MACNEQREVSKPWCILGNVVCVCERYYELLSETLTWWGQGKGTSSL